LSIEKSKHRPATGRARTLREHSRSRLGKDRGQGTSTEKADSQKRLPDHWANSGHSASVASKQELYNMNDASKLPVEPERLPTELCPFGWYGAQGRALDIVAEARGIHQSTLEDDNGMCNRLRDEANSIFDAVIVSIASHPDYRPTDPDIWDCVLDGVRSAIRPAGAVNAHVQALTGLEREKDGRASDVPATKLDLSKTVFPTEPEDYYVEYGKSANAKDGRRIDFADVKAATLRSLDFCRGASVLAMNGSSAIRLAMTRKPDLSASI
jgi:hypothetical protein